MHWRQGETPSGWEAGDGSAVVAGLSAFKAELLSAQQMLSCGLWRADLQ